MPKEGSETLTTLKLPNSPHKKGSDIIEDLPTIIRMDQTTIRGSVMRVLGLKKVMFLCQEEFGGAGKEVIVAVRNEDDKWVEVPYGDTVFL
ncbi:hypothetical protein JW758_05580 [Candidatus Peregrinibacteria bacterium]|nr:hypothetical protein [Candidatus Peregrinibacteria bacterium]